jgi:hypothetical protein
MRRGKKIIFITAISVLVICIVIAIAGFFIHLEFTYQDEEEIYEQARFIIPIVAFALTLSGTIKKKDSAGMVNSKVVLTFIVIFLFVGYSFLTALDNMCSYSIQKTIFEKKGNPPQKIVARNFGCGATDSSPASSSPARLTYYTSHFYIASPIDTTSINLQEWIRVDHD